MPATQRMLSKLVEKGIVAEDRLGECMDESQRSGLPPEEVLVRKGHATEEEVLRVLAEELGLEYKGDLSIPYFFIQIESFNDFLRDDLMT